MVCTIDQWGTQAIDVCVCFSGPFPLILSPFNTFSKAADAATAANARSFVDDPDCTPTISGLPCLLDCPLSLGGDYK